MEEDVVYLYTPRGLIYLLISGLFRRHIVVVPKGRDVSGQALSTSKCSQEALSAIEVGMTSMHYKIYEGSSNASHHCILAIWDSYRPHCRQPCCRQPRCCQSRPIIAHTGSPDRAYSACGVFSGALLLRSLQAQSMRGVALEIQVNRGPHMRQKGRDYEICAGVQGFEGPK